MFFSCKVAMRDLRLQLQLSGVVDEGLVAWYRYLGQTTGTKKFKFVQVAPANA